MHEGKALITLGVHDMRVGWKAFIDSIHGMRTIKHTSR